MAETSIPWTTYTFNPWWGCDEVSPGCANCYAREFDHRLGLANWGKTAPRRFFGADYWAKPLAWNRKAEREGVQERVFCASMADVFEIHQSPTIASQQRDARARLGDLIAATPYLIWLLLTKRPENGEQCFAELGFGGMEPLQNLWMLTTAEDQKRADERINHLLRIPAVVHGVSNEPALEYVDFRPWTYPKGAAGSCFDINGDWWHRPGSCPNCEPRLDWIITGGESGAKARPFYEQWARKIKQDCRESGAAFFFKQWGSDPRVDASRLRHWEWGGDIYQKPRFTEIDPDTWRVHLKDKKGENMSEWPRWSRVREFPKGLPL